MKDAGQEVCLHPINDGGALVRLRGFVAFHLNVLLLLTGDVHRVVLILQDADHLISEGDHHLDHIIGHHLLFVIECAADPDLPFDVDQGHLFGIGQGPQLDGLLLGIGLDHLSDVDHHLFSESHPLQCSENHHLL